MFSVAPPQSYRPVALDPATELLELRDVNAADLVPTQDPDAFPPDELTEAELDALFVAEMERRDRAAAHTPEGSDEPQSDPEPPTTGPRHIDVIDEQAEAEGAALERLAVLTRGVESSLWQWDADRRCCRVWRAQGSARGYVRIGWQVSTCALYQREPLGLTPRSGCRRRRARTSTTRKWDSSDLFTTRAARTERKQRRQAKNLARIAALEAAPQTLSLVQAGAAVGVTAGAVGEWVRDGRIPTTRVVQGLKRWIVFERDDLVRHLRRLAAL